MKTPHIVPLSRQSVEVLRALKLLTGRGELVFPGALDEDQPMSNNTILYALYRLSPPSRMTCWSVSKVDRKLGQILPSKRDWFRPTGQK